MRLHKTTLHPLGLVKRSDSSPSTLGPALERFELCDLQGNFKPAKSAESFEQEKPRAFYIAFKHQYHHGGWNKVPPFCTGIVLARRARDREQKNRGDRGVGRGGEKKERKIGENVLLNLGKSMQPSDISWRDLNLQATLSYNLPYIRYSLVRVRYDNLTYDELITELRVYTKERTSDRGRFKIGGGVSSGGGGGLLG